MKRPRHNGVGPIGGPAAHHRQHLEGTAVNLPTAREAMHAALLSTALR